MTRTVAELRTSGSGSIILLLEVPGIGVFTTHDYEPTDTWFVNAGYGAGRVYPWLEYEDVGPITEDISFCDPQKPIKVRGITLKIVDEAGGASALIKASRAWTHTFLTSTVTSTATSFGCSTTSGFSTSGHIYCGQEAVHHTSTTALAFVGCTRGALGTAQREHYAQVTKPPYEQATIAAGPHTLSGRRCVLHMAVVDEATGLPSATSVIYRGRIGKGVRYQGGVITLPIDHISEAFYDKVGQQLPVSLIQQGYWFSGNTNQINRIIEKRIYLSTMGIAPYSTIAQLNEGWRTPGTLMWEIQRAGAGTSPYVLWPGYGADGDRALLRQSALTDGYSEVIVIEGDPLWCMGFDAGQYCGPINAPLSTIAQNPPRPFCCDLTDATKRPQIRVADIGQFLSDCYVQSPGNPYQRVFSTGAPAADGSGAVYVDVGQGDIWRERAGWQFLACEDAEDATLRHVFALGTPIETFAATENSTVTRALKKLLHMISGQNEPESWCVCGPTSDDFDFTELDDALRGVLPELREYHDCIVSGTKLWDMVGPLLALCSISPRLTTEGRIGFAQMPAFLATEAATVEVNESVWELVHAAEIEAVMGEEPVINTVHVQHSYDYRGDSGADGNDGGGGGGDGGGTWGPPLRLIWREGAADFGEVSSVRLDCRGLLAGTGRGLDDVSQVETACNLQAMNGLFALFGRDYGYVSIPCVPHIMDQLRCGDLVKVTHELAPDPVEGGVGMVSRLGVIIGKRSPITKRDAGDLNILFGWELRTGGIAPCARVTVWSTVGPQPLTYRATFSGWATPEYSRDGETDLDRFATLAAAEATYVNLIDRDTTSPTTHGPLRITAVSTTTGRVTFASAGGFTLGAGGAYMTLADWPYSQTAAREYAFIATHSTSPALSSAEGMMWTV